MKAFDILEVLILIPVIVVLFNMAYGTGTSLFPDTTSQVEGYVNGLVDSVSKITNPTSVFDIIGGVILSLINIFGFILTLPILLGTFSRELFGLLGIPILTFIGQMFGWVLVVGGYLYYAKVIITWVNPSFSTTMGVGDNT